MTLASAYEDFQQRTLGALPGLWARLRYIAGLRGAAGSYRHWGMSRTFGSEATQHVVGTAHSELFVKLLRTPLRQLTTEFTEGKPSSDELLDWSLYVPANREGGSVEHFNSVVSALLALSEARRRPPTPGA